MALVKHFDADTLSVGELFQFLARDVVANHMLGADRQFFAYLQPKMSPGALVPGATG